MTIRFVEYKDLDPEVREQFDIEEGEYLKITTDSKRTSMEVVKGK